MASTKSTELSATEIELKRRARRRLIGAATIGLLGVVFLPMIFDGEPKRNAGDANLKKQEISIQVPAKDGLASLRAPSAAPLPPATVPVMVAPVKVPPPEVAKVVTEANVPKPSSAAPPAKSEKSVPAAKLSVVEKTGFVVQLGAFGDAEKSKQAVAMMKDAKLPVYTETIAIKTGTATRVRVGPFASREKADAALAQIKLLGSDGKIVPLQ